MVYFVHGSTLIAMCQAATFLTFPNNICQPPDNLFACLMSLICCQLRSHLLLPTYQPVDSHTTSLQLNSVRLLVPGNMLPLQLLGERSMVRTGRKSRIVAFGDKVATRVLRCKATPGCVVHCIQMLVNGKTCRYHSYLMVKSVKSRVSCNIS